MALVQNAERAFANVRIVGVALEIRSSESSVPRPLVLRVRRGVDADPPTTSLDVALERILLTRVQDVARRVEKYDGAETLQILLGECAGVLGGLHREAILAPQLLHCSNSGFDGAVSEARGFGENEDARLRALRGGSARSEERR